MPDLDAPRRVFVDNQAAAERARLVAAGGCLTYRSATARTVSSHCSERYGSLVPVADERLPDEAGQQINVEVVWPNLSGAPVQYANQIAVLTDGEDLHITFGQVSPPPIAGDPVVALAEMGALPIQPVARVVLSQPRATELLRLLQRVLDDNIDRGGSA
jgi:hypothetical protein